MNKQVLPYSKIKDKIIAAVDLLADPIKGTISPKGRNVIFQTDRGDYIATNDGVTIAKNISVKDPILNAIISILKFSSLKTNTEVGDGTSTSILLSQVLIKEGFKLIDGGWNQMDVKREFERIGDEIIEKLSGKALKADSEAELYNIAKISSNSDDEIARNVVKVAKCIGEHGMVFLEENNKPKTEIEERMGFQIGSGLFVQELRNNPKGFSASYKDVPVLITDKRLYYAEEAETILRTVLMSGHKSVVIVARDFIGQSINTFVANHTQGNCNVLLVKDDRVTEKNSETLEDLAVYLGGKVVSERKGSIVDNLTIDDFVLVDKVYADGIRTIITSQKKKNKALTDRVGALKEELDKDKDNEELKKRIASMTSGTVTIKVGGNTKIDLIERIYRYEDAVSATRAAAKDGYLIGGGVTLMGVFNDLKIEDMQLASVFKKFCEASTRQVIENHGGVHIESTLEDIKSKNKTAWTFGFNAVSGKVEDLKKCGVVDPYKVTEMAVRNSISVASQIIGSDYLIVDDPEDNNE